MTVCTGNICRSPAAAVLLRDRLDGIADVTSSGVRAVVTAGIPAQMLVHLDGAGLDGRGHQAQQATEALLRETNLVIAMADEHRRKIVAIAPAVARRLVLLDELGVAARAGAPLEGDTPSERLGNVAQAVAMFRPRFATQPPADVPDPFGRPDEVYAASFDMILRDVDDFTSWVMGSGWTKPTGGADPVSTLPWG